jgi:hypothetical protein
MGRDTERGMQAPVGGDKRSRASPRAVVGLAWLLCGASLALGVLGFVLESLNGQRITDSDVLGIVLLAITFHWSARWSRLGDPETRSAGSSARSASPMA